MSSAKDRLYLLVEGEPYLSACRDWRARHEATMEATFAFCASLGAKGFYPGFDEGFSHLTWVDPAPAGWEPVKKLRKSLARRLAPVKGPAGDAARAAIAALPPIPKWQEIATLIGHPCQIRYRTSNNECWGFSTCGVNFWKLVDISWAGDEFLILAKDTAPEIVALREKYPDVIIGEGVWSPPEGLRPISEARWKLKEAEQRVKMEEWEAARA